MSCKFKRVSIIGALVLLTSSFYGCEKADDVIASSELAARIESGSAPLILDVRTAEEYSAGHIPNAVNITHTELSDRLAELEAFKNEEIVVHCKSGKRALLAEKVLLQAGFTQVRDLEGHMLQWQENGYPLDSEDSGVGPL